MIAALQFRRVHATATLKHAVSRSAVEDIILDIPPVVAELTMAWLHLSASSYLLALTYKAQIYKRSSHPAASLSKACSIHRHDLY